MGDTLAMNRILSRVEEVRGLIASGRMPDGSPLADLGDLDERLAVDPEEVFVWRRIASAAGRSGVISVDEATTIDSAVGGDVGGSPANGGWATGTDIATKIGVTQIMGELMATILRRSEP